MWITKSKNEFSDGGDIFAGTTMFSGAKLSTGNYEGEIQDIAIFPGRGKQAESPLTHEVQFALRSELGKLSRVARISRPDS